MNLNDVKLDSFDYKWNALITIGIVKPFMISSDKWKAPLVSIFK